MIDVLDGSGDPQANTSASAFGSISVPAASFRFVWLGYFGHGWRYIGFRVIEIGIQFDRG